MLAAKTFLDIKVCPRSDFSCINELDISAKCAIRSLFIEIIQSHQQSVLSISEMSRTKFLGTVRSISEARAISQYPLHIESFRLVKTDLTCGVFVCRNTNCHDTCIECDQVPKLTHSSEFQPCDFTKPGWESKELAARIFLGVSRICGNITRVSIDESFQQLTSKFRHQFCTTYHCTSLYLEWLSILGIFRCE